MTNIGRWYIYIVCAASLQAVTWATIALLRNMFIFGINPDAVAFQVAVIIIGLPVFLAHWLWARRLAGRSAEERGASVRRIYLYGSMAGFLGPVVANAFNLIRRAVGGSGEYLSYQYSRLPQEEALIFHLVALIILSGMWFYHRQVAAEDSGMIPEAGSSATVRRLYVLGFSAAGLSMTTLAVIQLIRWLVVNFSGNLIQGVRMDLVLQNEIARLVVGVPTWIIFWVWGQRLFYRGGEEERSSALHKFYLYAAVFAGAISAVSNAAGILAGLFRRLLDLAPSGESHQALPIVITGGILWTYHALVLRAETGVAGEAPRQAGVRRIYLYLIAAVGLAALLVGMGGLIDLLIQVISRQLTDKTDAREMLSWYLAAVFVGTPVWVIPWRPAQNAALSPGPAGSQERHSTVRKVYLYFYMLVATLALLASLVFIVYRLFGMLLGEAAPTLAELGYSISAGLIAIGLWLYHVNTLRSDVNIARQEQVRVLESFYVVVVDTEEERFGRRAVDLLKRDLPGISLEPLHLQASEPEADEPVPDTESITQQLAGAGLIVGPWTIAVPDRGVSPQVVQTVFASSARKLLLPLPAEGWDWVGVEHLELEARVRQVVHAVKQVLAGEEVKPHRPLGAAAVFGIILAGLLFLSMVVTFLESVYW